MYEEFRSERGAGAMQAAHQRGHRDSEAGRRYGGAELLDVAEKESLLVAWAEIGHGSGNNLGTLA